MPSKIMASNMSLQPSLLHLIFLILIPSSFSSVEILKDGCLEWCGSLPIPFPFGVGLDCSLGPLFNILCTNTSTDNSSSKAFLPGFTNVEVVEIKPSQIRVRIPTMLSLACYNESGDYLYSSDDYSFYGNPFTFSNENWLTAIGCDDLVIASSADDEGFMDINQKSGSGCFSYCNDDKDGIGYCPDNDIGSPTDKGCCVSTISRGATQIALHLTDASNALRNSSEKLFSCSYAFIQEKGKLTPNQSGFSYPFSYLKSPDEFLDKSLNWIKKTAPVVRLDWRINGAKNCSQARRNATAYACGHNSVCVDFDASVEGYFCQCEDGYQGNPYLINGCKDYDECGDSKTNPCISKSVCINTNGSVTCSCPKGYYGDGRKIGRGCIQSKMIPIFIGVGSGLGFLLLLSISVLLHKAMLKRKSTMRKAKFFKQNGGLLLQQRTNGGTIGKTQLFHVEELEKATDNFNKNRILGQGGQGVVYKGMLSDGTIVAVKKSRHINKNQLDQFINEVVILSQINHRNIVQLLGCCLEIEVPLLVYEFLPNGTLSTLIHDPRIEFPISWSMRLKMAADIAGALAYLHFAASTPIYPRDIKSSNILLDETFAVKISDFGISRSVPVDQTHLTTQVHGTFGYFDPEYFQSNQFTEKSDVYSFGVVLVELLTGKKPISSDREEEEKSLVTRFLASVEDNNVDAILHPQVSEHGEKEEVKAAVFLARRCLNLHGKMRPTMKEVALQLESLRMTQMPEIGIHESEETRAYQAKNMMISNREYTWTASDISEIPTSSSDIYPLN